MINRIKNFIIRKFDKEKNQLHELSRRPRYTPGQFRINDKILRFPDSSSFVFNYREIFGKEIYRFETKSPAPLIVDCGANIGLSVIYFKSLFPGSRIIAFEPEKYIHKFLEENLTAFNISNVEVLNKAVWKENAMIDFSNEGADASRIDELESTQGFKGTYQVEGVKLSSFLNQKVDFLKLDIEGAEVEVMNEISSSLENVDNIFIEYHSFENKTQQLDTILSILSKNGFRYYIDAPVRANDSPFTQQVSWLGFDCFLNIYAKKISQ